MSVPDNNDHTTAPRVARSDLWHAGAWPITLKLTFLLMLIALVPTSWVSYTNLRTNLTDFRASALGHLAQTAGGLASQTSQLIDEHRKVAQLLAEDMDVRVYMSMPTKDRMDMQGAIDYQLSLMQRSNPDLSNIFLMVPSGEVIASTTPDFIGQNRGFRQYFMQGMAGNNYVSNLLTGLHSTEDGIYFSHPVHYNRERVGVAVIKLGSQAIERLFNEISDDKSVFMTDNNSVIVYHQDPAWRFKTIRQLDPDAAATIQEYSHFPVRELLFLGGSGLDRGLDATRPTSLTFIAPDNTTWIAGTSPATSSQWHIFIAEPQSKIEAPITALLHQTLIRQGIVALAIIVIALLLGNAFTRPVLSLTRIARLITSGDYKAALERQDFTAIGQRRDELGALAQVLKSMTEEVYRREFLLDEQVRARTSELAASNASLAHNHQRIQQELHLAREIQQAALPHHFPADGRFRLHALMQPAREMGGDFYDIYPLSDGKYGLVIADVCGKGVPAAFFMAMSSAILRESGHLSDNPARVLAHANQLLCQRNPMEMFVTVFYAVYDPANQHLSYSCAGHNPPYLRHSDGTVRQLDVTHDMALGMLPDMDYTAHEYVLADGDILLLYTDGVTEAMSPTGEEFGIARLTEWFSTSAKGLSCDAAATSLEHTIDQFVGDAEPSDDITMLLLQPREPLAPLASHHWDIPAQLEQIETVSVNIGHVLDDSTLLNGYNLPTFELTLCLDELLTNQIEHGMDGKTDSLIHIHLHYDLHWIEVTIKDEGHYYDPFIDAPAPALNASLEERPIGGLGVHFVKTLMDEFSVRRDGHTNITTLRKRIYPASNKTDTVA
jgi:serine phosphatase RsbU (regulator of sigma subunit)/anti-sigma regulatory factor (Ser/Thr protein kinase)